MIRAGSRLPRTAVFAAIIAVGSASSLHAKDEPSHYVLATFDEASWWKAQSRVLVDWPDGKPVMAGLECTASHNRNLQAGKPPMEIVISRPVESAAYNFRFHFNLAEGDLTNPRVESVTVGGRPYQVKLIQSRVIPWFGVHKPGDAILMYGIGRQMFRANDSYPWLPVEFLIPQFFEVEGIRLGIAGDFEISHGDYEKRYQELYIDMEGFKETLGWCYQQINPSGDRKIELPSELKRRIDR